MGREIRYINTMESLVLEKKIIRLVCRRMKVKANCTLRSERI